MYPSVSEATTVISLSEVQLINCFLQGYNRNCCNNPRDQSKLLQVSSRTAVNFVHSQGCHLHPGTPQVCSGTKHTGQLRGRHTACCHSTLKEKPPKVTWVHSPSAGSEGGSNKHFHTICHRRGVFRIGGFLGEGLSLKDTKRAQKQCSIVILAEHNILLNWFGFSCLGVFSAN